MHIEWKLADRTEISLTELPNPKRLAVSVGGTSVLKTENLAGPLEFSLPDGRQGKITVTNGPELFLKHTFYQLEVDGVVFSSSGEAEQQQFDKEENTESIEVGAAKWRSMIARDAEEQKSPLSKIVTLGITLFVFVATLGVDNITSTLTALVPVILVHELGHLLAMRLLGYTDLNVFFIPFIGAGATGKELKPSQTKRALVSLMGPLPGLVLALVLLATTDLASNEYWGHVIFLLLVLNLFNLIPIKPLDGGQIMDSLVTSRSVPVTVVFSIVSPIVLGLVALSLGSYFILGFAVLLLIGAGNEIKLIRIAHNLNIKINEESPGTVEGTTDKDLMRIINETRNRMKNAADKTIARMTVRIIQMAGIPRASGAATAAILITTFFIALFGIIGISVSSYQASSSNPVYEGKHISEWMEDMHSGDLRRNQEARAALKRALSQPESMDRAGVALAMSSIGPATTQVSCLIAEALEAELKMSTKPNPGIFEDVGAAGDFAFALGELDRIRNQLTA